MEIDWAGIQRVRKAMGGEQVLLLWKAKPAPSVEALDAATPPDDGSSPANGGWFATPQGPMLFLEGLDDELDAWIEILAGNLAASGFDGVLGAGRTADAPKWSSALTLASGFSANVGFILDRALRVPRGVRAWQARPETLELALDQSTSWLARHGASIQSDIDALVSFWSSPTAARQILRSEVTGPNGRGTADSYHQERSEVRRVRLSSPNKASFGSTSANVPWRETVDELRGMLLAMDHDQLAIAAISHLDWASLMGVVTPASSYYDMHSYNLHPEVWNEYSLDPCGIQILTSAHLAKANDLSAWNTTKLDHDHYLVQAHDLEPWYATPLRPSDSLPEDLITQARADFGQIVLTHALATQTGISVWN